MSEFDEEGAERDIVFYTSTKLSDRFKAYQLVSNSLLWTRQVVANRQPHRGRIEKVRLDRVAFRKRFFNPQAVGQRPADQQCQASQGSEPIVYSLPSARRQQILFRKRKKNKKGKRWNRGKGKGKARMVKAAYREKKPSKQELDDELDRYMANLNPH